MTFGYFRKAVNVPDSPDSFNREEVVTMTLTVDALIEALRVVQEAGYGHASVIIEEEGEGYFGDLLRVDTLMVDAAPTLTLVSAVAP